MKRTIIGVTLFLVTMTICKAELRLPSIIGDNMVLQRNSAARIWGWGNPESRVKIKPSWSDKDLIVQTESDGTWTVYVDTPEAGGPYSMDIVNGKEKLEIRNILIGEVWICSGQSNMEMPVHGFYGQPVEGSLETVLDACEYPDIRMFTIPPTPSFSPADDCRGMWLESTPANVRDFSAVGYYYGKYLNKVLGIPVGLITPNVGGIAIESWMTAESIRDTYGINHERSLSRRGDFDAACVSTLFNGMIVPIAGYSAKGFIWYQGESNQHNPEDYDKLMASMVKLWRSCWGNEEMPFLYVQLTPFPYGNPDGTTLPLVIEAQCKALKLIPDSWMAVTTDLGDRDFVHAPRKKEVGQRLAALSLDHVYGIEILPDSPTVSSIEFDGDKVVVSFAGVPDYSPAGLNSLDSSAGPVTGFELASEDRVFHPANAEILANTNKVCVSSSSVSCPVAVRYAFRNWHEANLRTTEGLPISPFRSDDW